MTLAMDRHVFIAKRKALKYTQEGLGDVLHFNQYTVKKWEGGSRKIPPFMIYAFAALEAGLKVPEHDVLPAHMLYVFAALNAKLKPETEGVLIEVEDGGKE